MRIAIIGTGISGLVAAHHLHKYHEITVFDKADYIGGHTNTLDVTLGDQTWAVDTGFIVFNEKTYPNFVKLLKELGVEARDSEMSFSVKCERTGLEYNGTNLDTLFAQRSNLAKPRFWGMLQDIMAFNKKATAFAEDPDADPKMTLGEFLDKGRYGTMFVDYYVLPMGAAIWSASRSNMLNFPMRFFAGFFHNHGMLSVNNRPQWKTVVSGSRSYVKKMVEPWRDRIRLNTPIEKVSRSGAGVWVQPKNGKAECFDEVIMAVHSDQALAMIDRPSLDESEVLGAIKYQKNEAILHMDDSVLPNINKCHAAWNYHITKGEEDPVTVTYHMNILQGLDAPANFLVTLNGGEEIDPSRIIKRIAYEHPIFSSDAVDAQQRYRDISGVNGIHFCGAYWYYGFHEDGVRSGIRVAQDIQALCAHSTQVVA